MHNVLDVEDHLLELRQNVIWTELQASNQQLPNFSHEVLKGILVPNKHLMVDDTE
jgi:hypothetical protein